MMETSFGSPINAALDPFLLESVCVEENGMTLSVLSALARLGLDPWVEASRLAALPKKTAVAAITRHFALRGDSPVAARLADLLPKVATPPPRGSRMDRGHGLVRRNLLLLLTLWLVACIAFMILRPSPRPDGPTVPTASSSNIAGPAR
jgi:hypothetical protein